jgi:hypothetical protein
MKESKTEDLNLEGTNLVQEPVEGNQDTIQTPVVNFTTDLSQSDLIPEKKKRHRRKKIEIEKEREEKNEQDQRRLTGVSGKQRRRRGKTGRLFFFE